ncbi:MAG: AAA family ATPase [Thermococci archaeon]|nr:AAA family ATPase [Thermococci archaeon]
MMIAVTGTPGVGKTTVAKLLASKLGYKYGSVRDIALRIGAAEKAGDELEIDVEALRSVRLEDTVVDGHLSHHMPADVVVVLRANPKVIAERLEERGYSSEKLGENVEAELVDVVLMEALENSERVIEVDTTGKTPEDVVEEILELLRSGTRRRVGVVDWSEVFDDVVRYLRK